MCKPEPRSVAPVRLSTNDLLLIPLTYPSVRTVAQRCGVSISSSALRSHRIIVPPKSDKTHPGYQITH